MQVYELMAILATQEAGAEVFVKVDLADNTVAGNWLTTAEFDSGLMDDSGALVLHAQIVDASEVDL